MIRIICDICDEEVKNDSFYYDVYLSPSKKINGEMLAPARRGQVCMNCIGNLSAKLPKEGKEENPPLPKWLTQS